jgi:hypothetical protein
MEDEKMSEKISAVMDICKIDPWSRRFSMEMGLGVDLDGHAVVDILKFKCSRFYCYALMAAWSSLLLLQSEIENIFFV